MAMLFSKTLTNKAATRTNWITQVQGIPSQPEHPKCKSDQDAKKMALLVQAMPFCKTLTKTTFRSNWLLITKVTNDFTRFSAPV